MACGLDLFGAGGGEGGANRGTGNGFVEDDASSRAQVASGGSLTSDTACAQATATAAIQPIDMFILLDHSASMGADCALGFPGTSLWCRATNALSSYFKSPSAKDNGAALQFFSLDTKCDGSAHGVSQIPGGATGYVTLPSPLFDVALEGASPVGGFGTRTEAAIRGLMAFTGNPLNRRAERSSIAIIVTDGNPNGCDEDSSRLSALLQDHFVATGVRTFLIGMTGADDATLEAISTGGNAPPHATDIGGLTGTCGSSASPCRHWNVGDGDGNVLVTALREIQASAIGCTLKIPKPDAGTIDLGKVKVEYSKDDSTKQELTRVANEAACVPDGFFYDDNTNATSVSLCPQICATVQATSGAKLDILFGCILHDDPK